MEKYGKPTVEETWGNRNWKPTWDMGNHQKCEEPMGNLWETYGKPMGNVVI